VTGGCRHSTHFSFAAFGLSNVTMDWLQQPAATAACEQPRQTSDCSGRSRPSTGNPIRAVINGAARSRGEWCRSCSTLRSKALCSRGVCRTHCSTTRPTTWRPSPLRNARRSTTRNPTAKSRENRSNRFGCFGCFVLHSSGVSRFPLHTLQLRTRYNWQCDVQHTTCYNLQCGVLLPTAILILILIFELIAALSC
jgi:hypothetical protein